LVTKVNFIIITRYPILLPNIFNHPFTYDSDLNLKVEDYVIVPFGKSEVTGVPSACFMIPDIGYRVFDVLGLVFVR
tara:strand:- start:719 stop:946 length:228 start_codon:yes stop_codon:yes gene_type:complete